MSTERAVQVWAGWFDDFFASLAGVFGRVEPRRMAMAYVKALVAPVERKNGWQIAEHVGHPSPDRVQWFLARSTWCADQLRDALRSFVVQFLARPDGVLVLDETAFLKKGRMSAGVAPQYAGITGQIENCQVAVFCAYATDTGRALIDRELYLPAAWCADAGRCRTQHIPRARAKAVVTKPELGRRMVERCRRVKVPFGWVAADSAYGQDRKLRAALERRRIPYVMAVPVDETVSTHGTGPWRVDKLAAGIPLIFERRSCGAGAKGLRSYDWALADVTWPGGAEGGPRRGHVHLLLVRRSITDPSQVAYCAVHAKAGTPIGEIVRVMGLRWSIEDCFETAKSDCGLDHYEVRTWDAWHRHITLSMAALAFLTITDTRSRHLQEPDGHDLRAPADPAQAPEKGARRAALKS
ncbi:IS701 family transposase [Streptomyces sp. SID12501]|uniref:IS701 family transposase n=1 Tax=Streptomyces sp. SID12501 TaxID=2706042 RepID=UPI0031BA3720